jgi:putative heme-binding domain-containing protein
MPGRQDGRIVSLWDRGIAEGWFMMRCFRWWVVWTSLGVALLAPTLGVSQTLDEELRGMPLAQLAEEAKSNGDATRGAVLFFQPHMACTKCHSVEPLDESTLGPNLASLGREVTDEQLAESVLFPSRRIRQGFESVTVTTVEGQVMVGLLVERTGTDLTLRDLNRGGELVTLNEEDIDEVHENAESIMPAGQVNQLTSRQQFLDLLQYLMEIRDGGPQRARELQPPATLLTFAIPEYEEHLDHAGLIESWDEESLQRGERIYQRVCANCHGTMDQPGSLPTSLRFAQGTFKNGSDPFAMYQTLTRGFGLMAAQTWMVPQQKYDVIHYIRETYLRSHNPSQYAAIEPTYLARLPRGDTWGPEPSSIEPWSAMDYGPTLTHTYEVPGPTHNFAYKGIAVRLDMGSGGVARGRHWMVFDTDTLRYAAAWSAHSDMPAGDEVARQGSTEANFIDWRGIQFNGEHQVHPRIVGDVAWTNSTGPGWGNPQTGSFRDDRRVEGRDGRRYGPLPRDWGRFRGLYHHGQKAILSYSVGTTDVLESPALVTLEDDARTPVFLRRLNVGARDRELVLQIAEHVMTDERTVSNEGHSSEGPPREAHSSEGLSGSKIVLPMLAGSAESEEQNRPSSRMMVGVLPRDLGMNWTVEQGKLRIKLPEGSEPLRFTIWTTNEPRGEARATGDDWTSLEPVIPEPQPNLQALLSGGPRRWPEQLETHVARGDDKGPFVVDTLSAPDSNPWLAQTRFTGLDFFSDGRIAVCSWDGDVWIVERVAEESPTGDSPHQVETERLLWQRIASGLFQPLGLKIVNEQIHLTCRDQLVVLHDQNGNGEIDYYQCLNNDHQVTEHFHEFAMGLQVDDDGNFYYAKSARHALPAIVPHHGTLLRVSQDGERTEILANGFRAANGVCLNPDGSFVVTDQEGHWIPKNRINWVTPDPAGKPTFHGNMMGYHEVTDASDAAMEQPLCWITNAFDRSPAELLWVDSPRWGPLDGALLNLSYGYGKVFLVLHEEIGEVRQGGMIALPIPLFPTGVMRGRFHPDDQQLYLCGMFAWAGSATEPGGLYRLRATGRPMYLPVKLQARAAQSTVSLAFTEALDADWLETGASEAGRVEVKTWSLKRTANYGSRHFDEKTLSIRGMSLSADGRVLTLEVPDLVPTWGMEIKYSLRSRSGEPIQGVIHNTVHQ